jgi:hypothetical protein
MAYLYPILPSIYVLGEKQESLKPAKTEKLETRESQVCSWATPKIKKISKTRDIVFLKKMFFGTPTKPVRKKQSTDNEDLNSVHQDERGGMITVNFVSVDDDTVMVVSIDSSVLDTPVVNNILGQSKYGCTY